MPSRVQARDEPCQDPARCDIHGHSRATPEHPQYVKQKQPAGYSTAQGASATSFYMITVDEGWRTWILCTDMYEWAADNLLVILRESGTTWPR